jgi:O-6-methylguanine DNA methyltransferase
MDVRYSAVETNWGEFLVGWSQEGIVSLHFPGCFPDVRLSSPRGLACHVARELDAYFAGKRRKFWIPLALRGTEFQLRVWQALLRIPYGKTVTYGELAERIGRPTAARAVGGAVGANPVPILVPCHRVVPKTGGIGHFGPGPEWKARLLWLEGVTRMDDG